MPSKPAPDYTENRPDYSFGDGVDGAAADDAANGLRSAIKAGRLRNELDEDLRIFVAPLEPTTRFLISFGKVISFPSENSPTGKRDMDREDDVWAEFRGGICATRDEKVIDWCLAHSGDAEFHAEYHRNLGTSPRECPVDPGLCRDADWEATANWADMKVLQAPTSRRSAQLPVDLDLNKLFDRLMPEMSRGPEGERMANAARAARNADRERTKGR